MATSKKASADRVARRQAAKDAFYADHPEYGPENLAEGEAAWLATPEAAETAADAGED